MNVNEGFAATFGSLDAPMGGMKNSGLGRRQGRDGIRRFVEVQSIGTQSGLPIAPSHGLNPKSFTTALTGVLRVLKSTGRPRATGARAKRLDSALSGPGPRGRCR